MECLAALHDMMDQEGQLHLQQGSPKAPNSLLQYHANLEDFINIKLAWRI